MIPSYHSIEKHRLASLWPHDIHRQNKGRQYSELVRKVGTILYLFMLR